MTLEKTLRSGLSTSLHPHGEGEGKLLSGAFLLPRQTLQIWGCDGNGASREPLDQLGSCGVQTFLVQAVSCLSILPLTMYEPFACS